MCFVGADCLLPHTHPKTALKNRRPPHNVKSLLKQVSQPGKQLSGLQRVVTALTLFLLFLCAAIQAVEADHRPTVCNISITGERYPVTYLNETRQNPDATFYPGDAFYYLFRWQDMSPPEHCDLQTPRLESSGQILNHTSIYRDYANGPVLRDVFVHHSREPQVAWLTDTHYHYGKTLEKCQAIYEKPGESRRSGWEKHAVYDKPFLVKEEDSRLTEFEKTEAKPVGKAVWEGWRSYNLHKGIGRDLPECPFDTAPRDEGLGPPLTWESDQIFYTHHHTWGFSRNNTNHQHLVATHADNNTRAAFDARVSELCSHLPPETGCMWGTSEIKAYQRNVCIHDYLTAREIDFTEVPEGIHKEAYTVPKDDCFNGDDSSGRVINHDLELTVNGAYLTGHHHPNSNVPVVGYKKETKNNQPPMQDPTLNIILTKPPLHHKEGYDAKNIDETYYHDDPIHIRHEPSWKWKDERATHISFTIDRWHQRLLLADAYHSTDVNTNYTFALPAWLAETLWYGNGDGMSVYVASPRYNFGDYRFDFFMQALNLGKPVANATNHTQAAVVPYNPQYLIVQSYPALIDTSEYAFDDRHGIAMLYAGSWHGDTLHEQRRSFLNGWIGVGQGHTPFTHEYIQREHILDEGRNSSPHRALEFVGDQTAMFVQRGYGTLLFDWPVSDEVFVDLEELHGGSGSARDSNNAPAQAPRYENVTSILGVYSFDFAGKSGTHLYQTILRYPEMPFTKQLTIESVDQSGSIQHGDHLTLRVLPYLGAEYMTEYIRDKMDHDVGDSVITQTILNDTHPMRQEWEGDGSIQATILRTTVYFDQFFVESDWKASNATDTGANNTHQNKLWQQRQDAIERLGWSVSPPPPEEEEEWQVPFATTATDPLTSQYESINLDKLAASPNTIRLDAPYDLGLSVLAPTTLQISINGDEHQIHNKYYAFGGRETISINAKKDNILTAERQAGRIIISEPTNFGIIKSLEINGSTIKQPRCPAGCTILAQPAGALHVVAHNEWGGQAHGFVDSAPVYTPPKAEEPQWLVILLSAVIPALVFLVYKWLQKV